MKLSGNTILITGGASGIGFALAERFAAAGSKVIVCGRREDQLEKARSEIPGLHTIQCDVSEESQRTALVKRVTREFPQLNVLVNNAGIRITSRRSTSRRTGAGITRKSPSTLKPRCTFACSFCRTF